MNTPETKDQHASHDDHDDHDHAGVFGEKSELIFAILCGVLLAAGWLIEITHTGPNWLPTAFYVTAYFFGGF